MVLPEDVRTYLIAWTAFCFVGRYINQTKPVSLYNWGVLMFETLKFNFSEAIGS
jgi:hypothetical protein